MMLVIQDEIKRFALGQASCKKSDSIRMQLNGIWTSNLGCFPNLEVTDLEAKQEPHFNHDGENSWSQ